jgi:hypothetical protein
MHKYLIKFVENHLRGCVVMSCDTMDMTRQNIGLTQLVLHNMLHHVSCIYEGIVIAKILELSHVEYI